MPTITLDGIDLDVRFKDIRNVHLSVHPPTGRVTISAPAGTRIDVLRAFAVSRLGWIRRQQRSMRGQDREDPREHVDRESHYLWGRRLLLEVREEEAAPAVEAGHQRIVLRVRPGTDAEGRAAVMAGWYRGQVREAATPLVDRWARDLGVPAPSFTVRQMRTMWGSCTPAAGSIRLNTELAKKPPECLEYIVVHEMAHLLEPTHNRRFQEIMDRAMPRWRSHRDRLNELPVRHEDWGH